MKRILDVVLGIVCLGIAVGGIFTGEYGGYGEALQFFVLASLLLRT